MFGLLQHILHGATLEKYLAASVVENETAQGNSGHPQNSACNTFGVWDGLGASLLLGPIYKPSLQYLWVEYLAEFQYDSISSYHENKLY